MFMYCVEIIEALEAYFRSHNDDDDDDDDDDDYNECRIYLIEMQLDSSVRH